MPLERKPDLAARILAFTLLACGSAAAQQAALPPSVSEIPETFKPKTDAFDFVRRDEMVPMRDGVKLRTIVLVPKGAKGAPILLARTPYDADERTSRTKSPRLASVVPQMMDTAVDAGYIIAYQDVRGKHGSEGDYVMNRPLRGPLNATDTDHATDTWDTIEWLVRNVPECNGRVGTIGGSYEGFTALMSTVRPHAALKVTVPFAPMVDGWMGDDWFHNGAFRAEGALEFTYNQQATRGSSEKWWSESYDSYDAWLRGGSVGAMATSRGLEQTGFWRQLAAHPAYDAWWQEQAMDRLLAKEPLTVPMMIVGGLFDQEDIYGAPALYKALAPKDPQGTKIHLVLGPWNHGQGRREGRGIGMVQFKGDTAGWFRRRVMQPFLDHYLKDAPRPVRHACWCTKQEPTPGIAMTAGRVPVPKAVLRSRATSTSWRRGNWDSPDPPTRARRSTNSFRIRRSPCLTACARRSARARRNPHGASGSWTTSARRRRGRTCSSMKPTR